ncbi:gluconokinase [Nocardioides sp. C4-1]|uniref:gluconokinase n=1 Tax=Nocardioides sp. C4-1 TaxID=3151851 RepID=UPI003263B7CA
MTGREVVHVVVMGVSSTGKSLVGRRLAERLGAEFVEGDDLHPQVNIDKMAAGTPLTDDDRWPWLEAIVERTRQVGADGRSTVVTCSALKRAYRDVLRTAAPDTFFVHLHGTFNLLAQRMREREGHFMPPSLLQSQFESLEPLDDDENGALVDVGAEPDAVVEAALAGLAGDPQPRPPSSAG